MPCSNVVCRIQTVKIYMQQMCCVTNAISMYSAHINRTHNYHTFLQVYTTVIRAQYTNARTLLDELEGLLDVREVLLFRRGAGDRHHQHAVLLHAPHVHRVSTRSVQRDVLYAVVDRAHCGKEREGLESWLLCLQYPGYVSRNSQQVI